MRRIMALGAEHGDELEAAMVVASIAYDRPKNVKGTLVNLLALYAGKRSIDVSMTNVFNGITKSTSYEQRRGAIVRQKIAEYDPYAVASLHNPAEGDQRFAVISPAMGVSPGYLGMLGELGIKNILTDKLGILHDRPNAAVIEIPKKEIQAQGIGFMRQFLNDFANRETLPTLGADAFNWFRYATTRDGGLHKNDMHPDELSEADWNAFQQFQPIPKIIQDRLESEEPLYLGCGRRTPNQDGFWGELWTPIPVPDTGHWPQD